MSSSQYDLYRRTNSEPGRSLFGWLRELWRPRRPEVEQAEVIPFPTHTVARPEREPERGGTKVA